MNIALRSFCTAVKPCVLLQAATLLLISVTVHAAIPYSERAALVNFYANTAGPVWVNSTGWLGAPGTECSWYGITCNAEGTAVTGIEMAGNGLRGTLPALSALTQLQTLNVANAGGGFNQAPAFNFLYGTIPQLSSLSQLQYVDLDSQIFTGSLPSLTGLSNLTHFEASSNYSLSGSIPDLTGLTSLNYFDLSLNKFTGLIPSLSGLTNLSYFDVGSNALTGQLPTLQGLSQLQSFYAGGNQITGGIPNISGLAQLQNFGVAGNLLNGSLPAQLTGLPNLQVFDVSSNFLNGTVPDFSALTELQDLWIGANYLTGSVSSLAALTQLQSFYMNYNAISGDAPQAPSQLVAKQSGLCPSSLNPASNPASANDMAWDKATGTTPWSQACTTPVTPLVFAFSNTNGRILPGQSVTYTAYVVGASATMPTGTLSFIESYDGISQAIAGCTNLPLVNGMATCTTSDFPGQYVQYQVTASYSGDANNAAVSIDQLPWAFVDVIQIPSGPATVVSAHVGQAVDLVAMKFDGAEISALDSPIDNTVSFYDGDTVLCSQVPISYSQNLTAAVSSGSLSGSYASQYAAVCPTTFSSAGNHALTVQYDSAQPTTPSTPVIQTVAAATPFDADQLALSGSWYRPVTSGQGMLFTVTPDAGGPGIGELAGAWFTFDPAGNPLWLTFAGNLTAAHGATYDLNIYTTAGGNFNAAPVIQGTPYGTASLTFYDCSDASLTYTFNDGRSGTIPQVRLSAATPTCSTAVPAVPPTSLPPTSLPANYNDWLHSGAWYNPATSGQGVLVDIEPAQNTFFAAWFTYAPSSEGLTGVDSLRWLVVAGGYTPGNLSLSNVPIYQVSGGLFNMPSSQLTEQVGTANVTFTSCTTMTISYSFTVGPPGLLYEYIGQTGTINEQILTPMPGCQ
jgi:hypothetical protein